MYFICQFSQTRAFLGYYATSIFYKSLCNLEATVKDVIIGGDFNFVAERGHWGGIGILEKAYGGTTDDKQMLDTITYSKQSLEWAEARELAKLPPDVRESFEAMKKDRTKIDIATKEQEKRIKKAGGTVAQVVTANSTSAGVEEKKKSSGVDDDQIQ